MTRVRELLAEHDFRWLLFGQFMAQAADGLAQATFAEELVLEPLSQRAPVRILALFALILVPYSLVSPWLGVFVDRWQRRGLLVWTNLARGGFLVALPLWARPLPGDSALYAAVLVLLGLGRLFLTTKSALLPVVLHEHYLLRGNSLSGGGGMIATLAGGVMGIGLVGWLGPWPSFAVAGGAYLAAAATVGLLSEPFGHPEVTESLGSAVSRVSGELVEGLRAIWARSHALLPLAGIFLLRTVGMFVAIGAILLIKQEFPEAGDRFGRLSVSALAIFAAGVGAFAGAVTVPFLGRRFTNAGLIVLGFVIAGVTMTALGGVLGLGVLLGLLMSGGYGTFVTKISVDAQVQEALPDRYRGRAFALYDILYNLASVAAAAVMVSLQDSDLGAAIVGVGIATLALAALLAQAMRRAGMFTGAPAVLPADH